MGTMALITDMIGVHTVLGAFVAGILVGESPILTRHIDEQLRGIITAFFTPVFFGIGGLAAPTSRSLPIRHDRAADRRPHRHRQHRQVRRRLLGAELGGLTPREGFALGCGMNARGSTEVIVATIGLSMGALNQNLFTMIVAMAVITTMAMPPTLRWALRAFRCARRKSSGSSARNWRSERLRAQSRAPAGRGRRQRERQIRLARRRHAGRHAWHADHRAAHPGRPKIETKPQRGQGQRQDRGARRQRPKRTPTARRPKKTRRRKSQDRRRSRKSRRKRPAKPSRRRPSRSRASRRRRRKPTTRSTSPPSCTKRPTPEVIAAGSRERLRPHDHRAGEDRRTRDKEFHASVTTLARGFEGPLAITDARDDLLKKPDAKLSILVPVNGTEASRRGAEVAITMARATKAPVTVLYVAVARRQARDAAQLRSRRHEEAILKDIVAIADGYNMSIRTAVLADRAADEAILQRGRAPQAQSDRDGRRPAPGRETVLRRHRRGAAGKIGVLAAVRGELSGPSSGLAAHRAQARRWSRLRGALLFPSSALAALARRELVVLRQDLARCGRRRRGCRASL